MLTVRQVWYLEFFRFCTLILLSTDKMLKANGRLIFHARVQVDVWAGENEMLYISDIKH